MEPICTSSSTTNGTAGALLSLVLVGLPELRERLELRHNRALYSRLSCRFSVEPLTPEDSGEYIRYGLKQVGCERELFTSDCFAMLHEAANGSLREVDRLATAALREAARRKKKLVERDILAPRRRRGHPPRSH